MFRKHNGESVVVLCEFIPCLEVVEYEFPVREGKGGFLTCTGVPKTQRLPGPYPENYLWTQWEKFKILAICNRTTVIDDDFYRHCFEPGGLIYKRGKDMAELNTKWSQSILAWENLFPDDPALLVTIGTAEALKFAHRRTQKPWLNEEDLMVNVIYNLNYEDMKQSHGKVWEQKGKQVRLLHPDRFLLPPTTLLGNRALRQLEPGVSTYNDLKMAAKDRKFRVVGKSGHLQQRQFIQMEVIPEIKTKRIAFVYGDARLPYHFRSIWGSLRGHDGDYRYVEGRTKEERAKDGETGAAFLQIRRSTEHVLYRGDNTQERISLMEFHKRFRFAHMCHIEDFRERLLPRIQRFSLVIWLGGGDVDPERVMVYLKSVVPNYLIEVI